MLRQRRQANDPFFTMLPPSVKTCADTTVYKTYSEVFQSLGKKGGNYWERYNEIEIRNQLSDKKVSNPYRGEVEKHNESLRAKASRNGGRSRRAAAAGGLSSLRP